MEFNLTNLKPDIRHLDDMREVLYDKNFARTAVNFDIYYMYRGIERKDDLRYDITIAPPQMLGKEFTKTKGHYHIAGMQEIFIILEGEVYYLMQKKMNDDNEKIEDVYVVKAKKGDVIIIPQYYGHVSINPSKIEKLKTGNWISDNCKSDYSPFEKMRGACYYYTKDGWVKNTNYKNVPELRFEEPLKSVPEDLNFLK